MINSPRTFVLLAALVIVPGGTSTYRPHSPLNESRGERDLSRATAGALGESLDKRAELSPARPGARFPYLAKAADGRIAMAWLERDADSLPLVRMSIRSTKGTWSAPVTAVRDSAVLVNFADAPRIVWAGREQMGLSYLSRPAVGVEGYGVRMRWSPDGGKSWRVGVAPHDTSEAGEHGFVSFLPLSGGRVGMTFLNGRDHIAKTGATQLTYAELSDDGRILRSKSVDARVCDCCQTSAAMTSSGMVAVYRDRTADDIRDISIIRNEGGTWSAPAMVSHDQWKISGCPVNGPAVSAKGSRVVVAWFTAAGDVPKVQAAYSDDGGRTFSAPLRIDGGSGAGHVDVEVLPNGSAVVSWLERLDGNRVSVQMRQLRWESRVISGSVISASALSKTATLSAPIQVGEVNGVRPAGFPVMVANGDGVLAAWTVPGSPSRVHVEEISGSRFK